MITLAEKLDAPLDQEHVASREQAGKSFSYLEAWAVFYDMNQIFGHLNWSSEILDKTLVMNDVVSHKDNGKDGWRVGYTITAKVRAKVGDAETLHVDIGYGQGVSYSDPGAAHESAIKEAVSDANKRAIRYFGGALGLHLYDKSRKNVVNYTQQAKQLLSLLSKKVKEKNLTYDLAAVEKAMMSKPTGKQAFEYLKQLNEEVNK